MAALANSARAQLGINSTEMTSPYPIGFNEKRFGRVGLRSEFGIPKLNLLMLRQELELNRKASKSQVLAHKAQ